MLSATLSDPDGRETLRRWLLAASRTRLSPLIEELKLDGPKTEKLLGIGADWGLRNLEAVAAFTEGKLTAEAAVQTVREAGLTPDVDAAPDAGAALVQQFDKQLGPFPLSAIQREALARVIEAEPPDVARGLAGDFTVRQVVSPEGLDGRFEEQTGSNQRILQAAAAFLSPEQVDSLRLMQTFNMSDQKRNALRMLRKL